MCLFGTMVTSLAMVVMHIDGTVFQIAYTMFGVAAGPLVGVFALGMLLPWCSTKVQPEKFIRTLGQGRWYLVVRARS